jgi:hypothetical protein
MKVGIFYNSISNPNKFSNKVMLMDNFRQGVQALGDEVIDYRGNQLPDQKLDVGFVLGYTLENNFRKKIINSLEAQKTPQVFVDSNILHYARPEHEWHRYSLNSVYPSDGVYFFDDLDVHKWNQYSQWHGVDVKPWRSNGDHILLLCQRPHGWNLFGNDQFKWIDKTVNTVRQYSNRPIVVRFHPGDGTKEAAAEQVKRRHGNAVQLSTNPHIVDDLKNCWCAVGYNSTPNVVAAIEGVPVYVEDPVNSWASDVAFTDLSQIENPPMPDRSEWIHRIANIHWSNREVCSGVLWRAIRSYIEPSR